MMTFPFFIGTTSFIYHDDILPNVRKLAPVIDDIELVLFIVEDDNNLPSPAVLHEIDTIAHENKMGFTIHLPLGASLGDCNQDVRVSSVNQARSIINLTKSLNPRAYVLHLNAGVPCVKEAKKFRSAWTDNCRSSLSAIADHLVPEKYVCIENLEGYDIEWLFPILDSTEVSLCLDIGHLWLQGKDPVHYIDGYAERIRVVHLHGIDKRDHSSLIHTDFKEVKRVLDALFSSHFTGVLTLEVFNEHDLSTSLGVVKKWAMERGVGI